MKNWVRTENENSLYPLITGILNKRLYGLFRQKKTGKRLRMKSRGLFSNLLSNLVFVSDFLKGLEGVEFSLYSRPPKRVTKILRSLIHIFGNSTGCGNNG